MSKSAYWLMKTEPETYSFEDLLRDRRTNWNGVRNYQARNHLRECREGDLVLIYHSVSGKAVVGVARVAKEAYPDPDPEQKGDWVQLDLEPVRPFSRPVPLDEIKGKPALKEIPLIKQSRLSVMPLPKGHFETLLKMGGVTL